MYSLLSPEDSVSLIKGVGAKKQERLAALNIYSVEDLLNHFPVRYRDRREIHRAINATEDRDCLVSGRLLKVNSRMLSGRRSMTECFFRDDSCTFNAVFFNMPYLKQNLKIGADYVLFGKARIKNGARVWTNPEICVMGSDRDRRGLIPVYRCTQGISSNDLAKWVRTVLDSFDEIPEWIDSGLVARYRLCDRTYAYENIHFPSGLEGYRIARFRLIFEQLLLYQLFVRLNRRSLISDDIDASIPEASIQPFLDLLPFTLTDGQTACIAELQADLSAAKPMNRLVQGDVGCGKTVVAEAMMYRCAAAGYQSAMMAPTEILARQHYEKISKDFEELGYKVGYLVSGMRVTQRRGILQGLADGTIHAVVGTHALLQEDVAFANLGLVVTDEQHRFGVNQRKTLVNKGRGVNVCVMSATPIPRTLAATVFGDMDFSVIRSKPASRKPIITRAVGPGSRDRAYVAVREELDKGHKAYILAPSIDSEDEDLSSVEQLYGEMTAKFKGYKVGLLHGKLSKEVKASIMDDFAEGRIQVLVATVVIEVGIDVPDATVMVIENSERFGLAQMHQLRGRVGRSELQSYCYLVNYSKSEVAVARARAMTELSDGFLISEEDYRLRGPGDITGTMQSGSYQSHIIDLCNYTEILEQAISAAEIIMENPGNTDMEYVQLFMESMSGRDNSNVL